MGVGFRFHEFEEGIRLKREDFATLSRGGVWGGGGECGAEGAKRPIDGSCEAGEVQGLHPLNEGGNHCGGGGGGG